MKNYQINTLKRLKMLSTVIIFSTLSQTIYADDVARDDVARNDIARGLEIATEAELRDTGFVDSIGKMTMQLENKQGQTSTRKVRVKTLEVAGDGDKGLSIFDSPADIKGTAALTYSHALDPDEQWIYLPALKRVKRISSKNKSGPFMGSEFAYEDISSQEIDKYTYKYIKDDVYKGINCFVIERYPAYKHSGYTRQVVWVNKVEYRTEKIDFYDRKNTLLKTLEHASYQQYLNRYWRSDIMVMLNHQTGKKTTLNWKDYQFKTGMTEKDFSRNSLKRAR